MDAKTLQVDVESAETAVPMASRLCDCPFPCRRQLPEPLNEVWYSADGDMDEMMTYGRYID